MVAWGLFRYRLFDIVPIARERVLENMADQVIVLDAQERVIDINLAALRTLGKKSLDVIGKPGSESEAKANQDRMVDDEDDK